MKQAENICHLQSNDIPKVPFCKTGRMETPDEWDSESSQLFSVC